MDPTSFDPIPFDYQSCSDVLLPDTDPFSFPPLEYGFRCAENTEAHETLLAPEISIPDYFLPPEGEQTCSQSFDDHEFVDWSSFEGSSSDSGSVWRDMEIPPVPVPRYTPGLDGLSFGQHPTVVDRSWSAPAAAFSSGLNSLISSEVQGATQPIHYPIANSSAPLPTTRSSTPTRPRAKRSRSMDLPVPVPGLTKKTRGRKVPTTTSEDSTRKWKCSECEARFVRFEHLKRHTRSIHTDEKLVCPHLGCGRTFSRNDNLKSHMRSHRAKI